MHVNESLVHNHTFLRALKENGGYTTGLFGKYLNVMPDASAGASPGDDHDNLPSAATPINVNQTLDGHIEIAGDIDVFKIRLQASQAYTLRTITNQTEPIDRGHDSRGRRRLWCVPRLQ